MRQDGSVGRGMATAPGPGAGPRTEGGAPYPRRRSRKKRIISREASGPLGSV